MVRNYRRVIVLHNLALDDETYCRPSRSSPKKDQSVELNPLHYCLFSLNLRNRSLLFIQPKFKTQLTIHDNQFNF